MFPKTRACMPHTCLTFSPAIFFRVRGGNPCHLFTSDELLRDFVAPARAAWPEAVDEVRIRVDGFTEADWMQDIGAGERPIFLSEIVSGVGGHTGKVEIGAYKCFSLVCVT